MKKALLLTTLFMFTLVLTTSAGTPPNTNDVPNITQSADGHLVTTGTATAENPSTNVFQYQNTTATPSTFDAPLSLNDQPIVATKQPNGKYTIAMYLDLEGGAINGMDDVLNESFREHEYAPSKGYKYRVWLGNLTGDQHKHMPEGMIDIGNKRVVFTDVVLKPGETPRVNLPTKVFAPDGTELKSRDKSGYHWAWIAVNADMAIIGIPDNGYRFTVQPDGTLMAAGKNLGPAL